jgi:hypothetical protein
MKLFLETRELENTELRTTVLCNLFRLCLEFSHKTVVVVYVREQGVGSVPFFFVSLSPRGPSEKIAFITMFIASSFRRRAALVFWVTRRTLLLGDSLFLNPFRTCKDVQVYGQPV